MPHAEGAASIRDELRDILRDLARLDTPAGVVALALIAWRVGEVAYHLHARLDAAALQGEPWASPGPRPSGWAPLLLAGAVGGSVGALVVLAASTG
jgi:hypothetical protein